MDEETNNNDTPVEAGDIEATPEVPVETATEETEEVQVNPFDFTTEEAESEESGDSTADAPEGEYTLDFGADFGGTDDVRNLITKQAREAGISAEAGSRFVAAVCRGLKEDAIAQGQAAYKALEEQWGAKFGKNMKDTKAALHGMLKEGVIAENEVAGLMNPAVFKLVNHLTSRMGEGGGAIGTKAAAKVDPATEYSRIMNDPKSHEFQVLMNPSHPEYKSVAERVNKLVGRRLY